MAYTHDDVMQALVAALRFGRSVGLAAMADDDALYPGAGCIVSVSDAAKGLLAEAEGHAKVLKGDWERGGISKYDLTRRYAGGDAE